MAALHCLPEFEGTRPHRLAIELGRRDVLAREEVLGHDGPRGQGRHEDEGAEGRLELDDRRVGIRGLDRRHEGAEDAGLAEPLHAPALHRGEILAAQADRCLGPEAVELEVDFQPIPVTRHELEEAVVTNLQKVRVDEEDETEELASLSDAAEALRLTAAAPPRPTPSGGDYE